MEFQEVMRQWKRMCNSIKSCVVCPMYNEDEWAHTLCSEGGILSAKPDVAEAAVAKWAAEHPEPEYPTWREWLLANRIIGDADGDYAAGLLMRCKRIPAEIAEKLGVEPKEDA